MRSIRLTTAVALCAVPLVVTAVSGCGSDATAASRGPTWTPAPTLTTRPSSFDWASPVQVRGKLLPQAWTSTASFTLPTGPATVVGILKVPGSTAPTFTARLVPVQRPASFAGYALAAATLWFMPPIRKGEGALAGWFPYALPAGGYRLMIRQIGGEQARGGYDLWVAGVK